MSDQLICHFSIKISSIDHRQYSVWHDYAFADCDWRHCCISWPQKRHWQLCRPAFSQLRGLYLPLWFRFLWQNTGDDKDLLWGVFAMIGGIIAAISLYFGHFILLCVGHFILGIAIIFFGFIRFAAAESVAESQRASAIAFVQGSTVVSALIGPNIFPATKYFLPTHTLLYSYLAISVIAILGSVICRALSAEIGKTTPDPSDETTGKSARKLPNFAINFPLFTYVPILACALSFGLMVFMMAPTPLSMKHHGHSDLHTSNVIVWHVVAMSPQALSPAN